MSRKAVVTAGLVGVAGGLALAWQPVDWREHGFAWPAEKFSRPRFTVELEGKSIPLHGAFHVRFRLTNPAGERILTVLSLVSDATGTGDLAILLDGPDPEAAPVVQHQAHESPFLGYLEPKETLLRSLRYVYRIRRPGTYSLRSRYSWRTQAGKDLDLDRMVWAESQSLQVKEPAGVDRDVVGWVGDPDRLLYLQDADLSVMPALLSAEGAKNPQERRVKIEIATREARSQTQRMRQELIERFPASTYARDVLYALAEESMKQGDYEAAVRAFERYGTLYPTSWFAEHATLHAAECRFELGQIQEARALLAGLAVKPEIDGAVKVEAARLQRGIESGTKDLQSLGQQPLYPTPITSGDE